MKTPVRRHDDTDAAVDGRRISPCAARGLIGLAHLPPAAPAMLRNCPPQHRRDLRRCKARPAIHQVAVDAARLRRRSARVVARRAHQRRVPSTP